MKRLILTVIAFALLGCAHDQYKDARHEVEAGNEEEGLARMEQLLKENPKDTELRNYYQRHRAVAVQRCPLVMTMPTSPAAVYQFSFQRRPRAGLRPEAQVGLVEVGPDAQRLEALGRVGVQQEGVRAHRRLGGGRRSRPWRTGWGPRPCTCSSTGGVGVIAP